MSDPEGTYRIYLEKGEKAPRGVEVIETSRGKRYYLKKKVRQFRQRASRAGKPVSPREEPVLPREEPVPVNTSVAGPESKKPQEIVWSTEEEPPGGYRDRRAQKRLVRVDALPQLRVEISPLGDGINPVEMLMYIPDILKDLVNEVKELRKAIETLNQRRGAG
jgi:hypothetical protein